MLDLETIKSRDFELIDMLVYLEQNGFKDTFSYEVLKKEYDLYEQLLKNVRGY